MASLKEIKNRIGAVGTTRKITQVRQTVSLARLHHSQRDLKSVTEYHNGIVSLLGRLTGGNEVSFKTDDNAGKPDKGRVAVVMMSSDSGMCGGFNARVAKEIAVIKKECAGEKLIFYPIGRKIKSALTAEGAEIAETPPTGNGAWADACAMVDHLAGKYISGEYKRVEVVYYRFKSVLSHEIAREALLPSPTPEATAEEADFITEPSREATEEGLRWLELKSRFYLFVVNNLTCEHAARTTAMRLATDNADEIMEELQLAHNKLRQQNITSELLDIIGSSFA